MSGPIETQIGEIRQYLEWEFPGQVRDTWWDEDARAPVFEVVHETGRHHVIVEMGFIRACQDAVAFLRTSELADYMREARAQTRRFLVLEERGEVHIRSTAL
jgi:predicted metalloprotease